jgi:rubrerythrin
MTMFYLQDSRSYVGNDVIWWGKDGKGYTTDLSRARIFTKDEAQRMHLDRTSDIPWPKDYIDGKTRPAVDMQYIKRSEALEGTGIEIRKDSKPKNEVLNCHQCGSFMSATQLLLGACPKCGTDKRP